MDIEPIRYEEAIPDSVYDRFTLEYTKFIPQKEDQIFSDLMNNIRDFYMYEGTYINLIKQNLNELQDISFLNNKISSKLIPFTNDKDLNIRLSILLVYIVKIRILAYQIAYKLATILASEQELDYKLHEDFHLAYKVIEENPTFNFYADLVIYFNTDRFFNECIMLELICDALMGKDIKLYSINNFDYNTRQLHQETFNYLEKRYVIRSSK